MGLTLEEIEKRIEELDNLLDKAFDLPTVTQYMDECDKIYQLKLPLLFEKDKLTDIVFENELPDYGDLMSLEDFISCCNSGGFIDYDGFGRYANSTHETNITISPSKVKRGMILKDPRLTHVVWYNR